MIDDFLHAIYRSQIMPFAETLFFKELFLIKLYLQQNEIAPLLSKKGNENNIAIVLKGLLYTVDKVDSHTITRTTVMMMMICGFPSQENLLYWKRMSAVWWVTWPIAG